MYIQHHFPKSCCVCDIFHFRSVRNLKQRK